jgi:hypothetical protein
VWKKSGDVWKKGGDGWKKSGEREEGLPHGRRPPASQPGCSVAVNHRSVAQSSTVENPDA